MKVSGEANVNKNQTVINIHTINKNKTKVIFKVIINLQKRDSAVAMVTTAGKESARGNRSFHQLCSTSFHGCEVEFLLNKFLPGSSREHLEESEREETRTKNIIYIYLYIRMPIFKIFLIINMYLVAFFFLFSLNNQQNRHHHHHHFHSSVKGTGRGGIGAGRGGTERGEGGGV